METLPPTLGRAAGKHRRAALRRHGFEPSAGSWHRGDIAFRVTRCWLVFSAPWTELADPLRALGAFGLWKAVCDGQQMRRTFAVHDSWLNDDGLFSDEERTSFDCLVEWVLATADGALPTGWTVPERASIDACLDRSRLTLVHRAC